MSSIIYTGISVLSLLLSVVASKGTVTAVFISIVSKLIVNLVKIVIAFRNHENG